VTGRSPPRTLGKLVVAAAGSRPVQQVAHALRLDRKASIIGLDLACVRDDGVAYRVGDATTPQGQQHFGQAGGAVYGPVAHTAGAASDHLDQPREQIEVTFVRRASSECAHQLRAPAAWPLLPGDVEFKVTAIVSASALRARKQSTSLATLPPRAAAIAPQ